MQKSPCFFHLHSPAYAQTKCISVPISFFVYGFSLFLIGMRRKKRNETQLLQLALGKYRARGVPVDYPLGRTRAAAALLRLLRFCLNRSGCSKGSSIRQGGIDLVDSATALGLRRDDNYARLILTRSLQRDVRLGNNLQSLP
jgi:hypothetical protein